MIGRVVVRAVVCLLALTRVAGAQLAELQPGAKVRVTAPSVFGSRYEAIVGSRTADTLWLVRSGSPTVQLPVSALTGVQLSRGRSRMDGAKRGLFWGAGIGLAVGVVTAAGYRSVRDDYGACAVFVTPSSSSSSSFPSGCEDPTTTELLASALLGGTVWGAGIGALVGRERWEALSVPSRVGVQLDRVPGGGRLGLRVAF